MATKPRPFRLKPPKVAEAELHEHVAELLNKLLCPPAMWTTINAGHVKLPAHIGAKLKRLGVKRGWPDILIVHDFRPFGIELKDETGKLSKTTIRHHRRTGRPIIYEGQEDVHPKLERAGMIIEVCRTVDDVLLALHRFNVPLRISSGPELTA